MYFNVYIVPLYSTYKAINNATNFITIYSNNVCAIIQKIIFNFIKAKSLSKKYNTRHLLTRTV